MYSSTQMITAWLSVRIDALPPQTLALDGPVLPLISDSVTTVQDMEYNNPTFDRAKEELIEELVNLSLIHI